MKRPPKGLSLMQAMEQSPCPGRQPDIESVYRLVASLLASLMDIFLR